MNIAEWCIKNNRTTIVSLLLVALAGVISFNSLSRLEDPEFTIRAAVVVTYFPGASPLRVEQLVTDKLEKKIREIAEVETVTSESRSGVSLIYVEVFEKYDDMKPIWDKLRNKVDDARSSLPEGVMTPVINDEFGDVFGVVAVLTGDGYSYSELKDVADDARDELLKLPSVAKVDLYGTQEEQVFIEFSNSRLASHGMSPYQLANVIKGQNAVQPGGDALSGPERVVIEATGEFKSLEQIRNTTIRIPGTPEGLQLKDIASVERSFVDPATTMTRFNGERALVLAVSMTSGGNIIEMGQAVKDRLDRLTADLPMGLEFDMLVYQPRFVERSVNEFMVNLIEAFVFVFIVMLIFAGVRMGLIAGALVPMAMLLCIALMPAFDVDLQQVSIASLIIALGMLVDNGVVVSENIMVRMASGESRLKAASGAIGELWLPLLAASLTTICAFLPIAIAESAVGEYCISLFIVVSLTLLSSWVLSLTMMPLLCYLFLKPKKQSQDFGSRFYVSYRNILVWSLKHRGLVLAGVVVLFIAGCMAFNKFVPKIFFPSNAREMFLVDFWQPYGTDIRTTSERAAVLENFLCKDDDVDSVGVFVGSGGPRWYLALSPEQDNPNYAFFIVNTVKKDNVDRIMERTREFIDATFPDAVCTVKKLETGTPVGAPIQIRITGDDIATLYSLRDSIEGVIRDVPGVSNVRDDWGEWTKKMVVDVNQERAKNAGLTSQDVGMSLQTQISGLEVSEYREGTDLIPIVLRTKQAYREDIGNIEGINVYSYSDGKSVPLMQVANASLDWQPSNIKRRNAERTMNVKVDVSGRFASDVLADIIPEVDGLKSSSNWPAGYGIAYGGEYEESAKAEKSIMDGLPLALGLLVLVLIAQFNSIRRPLIIGLTIPPMIVGITIGLLLTGQPFGFMAMLGMISLMGIIVNNAIMMIDRMEIEQALGQSAQDAIVLSAQRRFRPILMTTITTIVGLIPLSIQGGELWRPMANVIIFGLAFATLLTLVLCPVLYSMFFKAGFRDYNWDPAVLDRSAE